MAPDGTETWISGVWGIVTRWFQVTFLNYYSTMLLQAASSGAPSFVRAFEKWKPSFSICFTKNTIFLDFHSETIDLPWFPVSCPGVPHPIPFWTLQYRKVFSRMANRSTRIFDAGGQDVAQPQSMHCESDHTTYPHIVVEALFSAADKLILRIQQGGNH